MWMWVEREMCVCVYVCMGIWVCECRCVWVCVHKDSYPLFLPFPVKQQNCTHTAVRYSLIRSIYLQRHQNIAMQHDFEVLEVVRTIY